MRSRSAGPARLTLDAEEPLTAGADWIIHRGGLYLSSACIECGGHPTRLCFSPERAGVRGAHSAGGCSIGSHASDSPSPSACSPRRAPGFVMPGPLLVRRRRRGYARSRRTVPNAFPHGPHSMEWGMHGRCGDPGAVCKDTARSAQDRARQLRGAPPRPRVSGASSAPVASIPCSPMRKRRRQA